jgi:peroxisomal 2,4-dienoyl-CoA reductase
MVSAKGLEQSAAALSKSTGRRCVAASADVRNPEQLVAAVSKARSEFGRIDHVICGAAGNL